MIYAEGEHFALHDEKFIHVYDGRWNMSRELWAEIQKARWKDVILNEETKKTLTELVRRFFESSPCKPLR